MPIATLSQKHQLVLPKDARHQMGVGAGSQLLVETIHGVTILLPKPKRFAAALRGLAKGLYPHRYLARERKSWRN